MTGGVDEVWKLNAACRRYDPDLWFPAHGHTSDRDKAYAKNICKFSCPVVEECLRYALRHGLEHGIWGGTEPWERRYPPTDTGQCGTTKGRDAHRRRNERPCPPCAAAGAAYAAELKRNERAAARRRQEAPSGPACGTVHGYYVHDAHGQKPCRPCAEAMQARAAA